MGTEHRVIRMVAARRDGIVEVRAAIEDRFHNFRVSAALSSSSVADIAIEPIRFPYTLCPAAGSRLDMLRGAAVSPRMSDYSRLLDSRHQCTHQFDTAAMALALATRGVLTRRYQIAATELSEGVIKGMIACDGAEILRMRIEHGVIVAPADFAGRPLGSGFTTWSATLDIEMAEAALLLRRMIFIAMDSRHADDYERAVHAPAFGGCWVQQPAQNTSAIRLKGRVLGIDVPVGRLTTGDEAFLTLV